MRVAPGRVSYEWLLDVELGPLHAYRQSMRSILMRI